MAGIRANVCDFGTDFNPDRYQTLAREAVLFDEVRTALTSVSDDYSVSENDHTILIDTSGATGKTVTLPEARDLPNREYRIKNAGSGVDVTLTAAQGDIDGAVSVSVSNNACFTVKSDGSNWFILDAYTTGGIIPASTQFLGYFTRTEFDSGTPDANAANYGFWCMVRETSEHSTEYICHQNSDDSYVWVPRSAAQY